MEAAKSILSTEATALLAKTTTLLALGHLVAYLFRSVRDYHRLPPGPKGHPFWGMLLKITKDFYLVMQDLNREVGSIVSFRMGRQIMVSINDFKLIKEAMKSDKFVFRPYTKLFDFMQGYGERQRLTSWLS